MQPVISSSQLSTYRIDLVNWEAHINMSGSLFDTADSALYPFQIFSSRILHMSRCSPSLIHTRRRKLLPASAALRVRCRLMLGVENTKRGPH